MSHLLQYHHRVVGSDGLTYMVPRGRPYPKDQPPPQPTVKAALTGFEVFSDSRGVVEPPGPGVPGGLAAREALVFDTYVPQVENVGIYTPISALTAYNAPSTVGVTITTPNTVIQDKIIYGVVKRGCNNVIFRNCLFRGPPSTPTSETAIINCNDTTYKGWELWDCTFAPQWPNEMMDSVKSNNFKLFRCHSFWSSDGFGVFSNAAAPANGGTNVEIAGCLVEDLAYWHGDLYAYYNGPIYLLNTGSYAAYNAANDANYVKRLVQEPGIRYYFNKHDGSHLDCVQIQGAYGRMVRNTTTGKWSGDGVYIHGNYMAGKDALGPTGHGRDPSGLGLPIPGETGSLAGSRLGYGDGNQRQTTGQKPVETRPYINGDKLLPNGQYAHHGSCFQIQQNVNRYPYPDATHPDDYTVVCQYNFLDNYVQGVQFTQGSFGSMNVAWLHNTATANVFRHSSNSPTTCSIYPERVYERATIGFATDVDGSPGLPTNLWSDPANIYGRDGLPLIEGPRGGLQYG